MSSEPSIDFDRLTITKLSPTHNLSAFDATDCELQEFIRDEALAYQKEALGVTYLVILESSIVAFFTLAMNSIPTEKLELQEIIRIRGKVNHPYPALLLGRLAVDKEWQSKGIGSFILEWVFGLARSLSASVGCRYVCLHCRDHMVKYYGDRGFERCEIEKKLNEPNWMYRRCV